jgi:hypothetical protein
VARRALSPGWQRIALAVVNVSVDHHDAEVSTYERPRLMPRGLRLHPDGTTTFADIGAMWIEVAEAELALAAAAPRVLGTFCAAKIHDDNRLEVLVARDTIPGVGFDRVMGVLDRSTGQVPLEIACATAAFVGNVALQVPPRIDPTHFHISWDGVLHAKPDLRPRDARHLTPIHTSWIAPEDRGATTLTDGAPTIAYRVASALHSLLSPPPVRLAWDELLRTREQQAPAFLGATRRDVDNGLAELVAHALSTSPSARPTPEALIEACERRATEARDFWSGLLRAELADDRREDLAAWDDIALIDPLRVHNARISPMRRPRRSLRALLVEIEARQASPGRRRPHR